MSRNSECWGYCRVWRSNSESRTSFDSEQWNVYLFNRREGGFSIQEPQYPHFRPQGSTLPPALSSGYEMYYGILDNSGLTPFLLFCLAITVLVRALKQPICRHRAHRPPWGIMCLAEYVSCRAIILDQPLSRRANPKIQEGCTSMVDLPKWPAQTSLSTNKSFYVGPEDTASSGQVRNCGS